MLIDRTTRPASGHGHAGRHSGRAASWRSAILAAAMVTTAIGLGGAAQAQEQAIDLISAPFGTGSYVIGSAVESLAASDPSIEISHSESPGFAYNIQLVDRRPEVRENTVIGSGRGIIGLARAGEGPFEKQHELPVQLLGNYLLVAAWLATLDPEIQSVEDLAGKSIALGREPQVNWTIQPEALLRRGLGYSDDQLDIQYLGPNEAKDALLDGTVDAAVVGGYFNPGTSDLALSPQTSELLASGRDVRFLSWGEVAVQKAIDSGLLVTPYTIEAGAADGIAEALQVFSDNAAFVVMPEFPEEAAYAFAKLLVENTAKFGEYSAVGKLISPESLVYGWDREDIAPGALRAYQEAGVLD